MGEMLSFLKFALKIVRGCDGSGDAGAWVGDCWNGAYIADSCVFSNFSTTLPPPIASTTAILREKKKPGIDNLSF